MFVAATDFDYGDFILVGLEGLDDGEFDRFVSYHEERELRKLLGSLFYDAFVKGLSELPDELDLWDEEKAYALNNECVFIVDNVADLYKALDGTTGDQPEQSPLIWEKQPVNRWVRLKFGDAFTYCDNPAKWFGFKTLVTPLIYSKWNRKIARTPTVSGVVIPGKENSIVVSSNEEIIKGWNEYARLSVNDQDINNLFLYLYTKSADFDDLVSNSFQAYLGRNFTYPGRINDFGI